MSFEPCFEAICGEAGSQAKYFSRGSGYLLFLTPTEAVLDAGPSKESTLRMKLLRSNSRASMQGMDPLPGKSNYFIGKNPKSWRSNVTNYAKVRYRNVYRGVDLVYYGNGSQLEYDFVVAPRADPRAIALTFPGARSVSIDQTGDLVLATDNGEIVQRKPRVWQQIGESKREIAARYAITSKNEVRFELDHYDASAALVIDPVLVYSIFVEGLAYVSGAVDGAGNVYVTGSSGGGRSMIKKLDPTGTSVIYTTYIEGSGTSDIAVDAGGNVYMTGFAYTPDFPATPGAFQTQIVSAGAPFVAKVDATGIVGLCHLSQSLRRRFTLGRLRRPPVCGPLLHSCGFVRLRVCNRNHAVQELSHYAGGFPSPLGRRLEHFRDQAEPHGHGSFLFHLPRRRRAGGLVIWHEPGGHGHCSGCRRQRLRLGLDGCERLPHHTGRSSVSRRGLIRRLREQVKPDRLVAGVFDPCAPAPNEHGNGGRCRQCVRGRLQPRGRTPPHSGRV